MLITTKFLRYASWEWWWKSSKRAMRSWQWSVKLKKLLDDDGLSKWVYKSKKKKHITYNVLRPWDKLTVRCWYIEWENKKKYTPFWWVDVDIEIISYSFNKRWKPIYVVKDIDWDLFTYKPH